MTPTSGLVQDRCRRVHPPRRVEPRNPKSPHKLTLTPLAVGALALTLIGSVRRHQRDLAILKTIGFMRGQVFATVAWQATALAVGALVVGVPCGVALGRWTWDLVATGVGSVSPPIVPLMNVIAVGAATLLVANLL